jgi:hypothetical protein
MVVLGTLLVLAGATVVVLRALGSPLATPDSAEATTEVAPTGTGTRLVRAARTLPGPDRLIGWGVLLLVLGALAAGAIGINLNAVAGNR